MIRECVACGDLVNAVPTLAGNEVLLLPVPSRGGRWTLQADLARFVGGRRGQYANHVLRCVPR